MEVKRHWWKEKNNVHDALFKKVDMLEKAQSAVTQDFARYLFMYGGARALNYYAMADLTAQAVITLGGVQLSLNVVKAFCDTQLSKLGKNKARPFFITEKGLWDAQTSAKRLTMFVDGQFKKSEVYDKSDKVFQASTIWGSGCAKIYDKGEEICFDSLIPQEQVRVDLEECKYGAPKTFYEVHYIDRETVKAEFPGFDGVIDAADSGRGMFGSTNFHQNGNVKVVEALRMPIGKVKGRHVIAIDGATLHDEVWEDKDHPYVFYHYDLAPVGFLGTGIPEAIFSIQIEINKILRRIQKSIHIMSVPRVFLPDGSTMVKNHFSNEIGEIIELSGAAPVIAIAQSVAPDLANHLIFLITQAAEIVGVSKMSYASQKPAGLDSGKAIREYSDVETERHASASVRWELFFLKCAKKFIQCTTRIDEKLKKEYANAKKKDGLKKRYEILVDQGKFTERIAWDSIGLKEDDYIMKCYPTNLLGKTPAAKLNDVKEMFASQMIDAVTAQYLLDFPDMEAVTSLQTAHFKAIMAVIELLVEGKYESPDPLMDLVEAQKWITYGYFNYKSMGLPESRLQLFRQWIDEAEYLMNPEEENPEMPSMEEAMPGMEEMPMDEAALMEQMPQDPQMQPQI
jgi:hypothetical protein